MVTVEDMHPEAAGLDIGSTEVYAAVRPERDPDSQVHPRVPIDKPTMTEGHHVCTRLPPLLPGLGRGSLSGRAISIGTRGRF